ncbi:MAG TPA: hypothetical protein PK993_03545 [Clostridia bacterium]|jgi:hypothetical protein|nr:hypothetical protein [Clostridia bacterium]
MKKTQEKKKNVNKVLIIVLIALTASTLILTTVWALFSARKTESSEIRIGKIDVKLVEDWPKIGDPVDPSNPVEDYDEYGIEKSTKVVKGNSLGDLPAYVRIKCIPILQYYYVEDGQTEGEWITAPVAQDKMILFANGSNWVRSGDYYYYTKIVDGFGQTEDLNINWTVGEIPSNIETYPIRTDVRVVLEYSQTTNDAWKDVFKIEQLPEGMEIYTPQP